MHLANVNLVLVSYYIRSGSCPIFWSISQYWVKKNLLWCLKKKNFVFYPICFIELFHWIHSSVAKYKLPKVLLFWANSEMRRGPDVQKLPLTLIWSYHKPLKFFTCLHQPGEAGLSSRDWCKKNENMNAPLI